MNHTDAIVSRLGWISAVMGLTLMVSAAAGRADALSDVPWRGRWQTWQKTDAGKIKPLGLYQDLACTNPATAAGDVVMAFRDELGGKGLVLAQTNRDMAPTLQFADGRPVLRFDGTNDHLLAAMELPLASLDIWVRYRIYRAPGRNQHSPSVFSGTAAGGYDFLTNGFRLLTSDKLRSTGQNTMQVFHLSTGDSKERLFAEGLEIHDGQSRKGTSTQFCLGSGMTPKPNCFVAMDLEAVLVGLAVPPETYTAIDTSLGARLETPRLVCAGDSLTDGSHGGGNCSIPATLEYPSQLQLLRPKRFVINSGNWGARIGSLLPVDQYFTDGGQLVVFAGSNDVTGGSPAEAIVRELSAYCRTRREKGWKVYVCTLLPRSFVGGTNPPKDFEERRQAVNTQVRETYKEFADGLVDFGADKRVGQAGAQSNATYYAPDLVHLTPEGAKVLAELVNRALPKR